MIFPGLKHNLFNLIILCLSYSHSQTDTAYITHLKENHQNAKINLDTKQLFIPSTLAILSITLQTDSSKYGLQKLIQQPFNGFHTELDDYIQYAPLAMMYGADCLGVKAKHDAWNQTKLLAISEIGTSIITQILKYSLRIERPDGTKKNSFPSGHTGQSFVAAQVLRNEFANTHPLFSYSGYLFAISTGTLRIVNNRHWLPDVLMGAALGIAITNVVYRIEPLKNWKSPFKKRKNETKIGFIPSWNSEYFGGYLTINF